MPAQMPGKGGRKTDKEERERRKGEKKKKRGRRRKPAICACTVHAVRHTYVQYFGRAHTYSTQEPANYQLDVPHFGCDHAGARKIFPASILAWMS